MHHGQGVSGRQNDAFWEVTFVKFSNFKMLVQESTEEGSLLGNSSPKCALDRGLGVTLTP